jgi:hypothetical protein
MHLARFGLAVTVPLVLLFGALLVMFLVSIEWAELDPRLPFLLALGLMVVAALVYSLGYVSAADTLAEYVLLTLAGGLFLLFIDLVPSRSPRSRTQPTIRESATASESPSTGNR